MLTQEEIISFVDRLESQLLTVDRHDFAFDKKWSSNFPQEPGIYMIFDNGNPIYVGESANVKERMKEVKRTVNHAFRKKLGKHLYNGTVDRGKFSLEIEDLLNQYYLDNLTFCSVPLRFGRLEVEAHLINRHQNSLLNSVSRRQNLLF